MSAQECFLREIFCFSSILYHAHDISKYTLIVSLEKNRGTLYLKFGPLCNRRMRFHFFLSFD